MKSTLLLLAATFIPNSILASNRTPISVIREIEAATKNTSAIDHLEELYVLEPVTLDKELLDRLNKIDVDSHSWIQQGLPVTENSLNMAIFGQGFFLLTDSSTGALKVTRDGRFQIDVDGNLVHWENHDQVLQYIDNGYSNIRITDTAVIENPVTKELSHIHHFEITKDGAIIGVYDNDQTRPIAKLALVDFENPRQIKRVGQHLFISTSESGLPNFFSKNWVYGNTLEHLDEEIYELMGFSRWQ